MVRPGKGRAQTAATSVAAGQLRLDLAEQRATLDGRDLHLSPLLMRLLGLMVQQSHRLITRHQLKQELWPNSDRIDTERRLNTAVRALRAALNDDVEAPKFIETVRSHGYRWIGPAPEGADKAKAPPATRVAVILLAIVAAATLAVVIAKREDAPPEPPPTVSLVRAQSAMDEWRAAPNAPHLNSAERAIALALDRAPSSPAVHVISAQLALEAKWDWRRAEQDYARALELDPANADARLGMAWLKVNRGDTAGALADANALLLNSIVAGDRKTDLGWLLIRAGRPDLATAACPPTATNLNSLSCAHTALAAVGQLEQARAAAARLMRLKNSPPALVAMVEREPAEAAYKQFLLWRAREFLPADAANFDRAQVLAEAGFSTEALDMLTRSVAAREPLAVKIFSSPAFMTLRTNPRYQALAKKVGIPDAL